MKLNSQYFTVNGLRMWKYCILVKNISTRKGFEMMNSKQLVKVDLNNEIHCEKVISLINEYMEDDMGRGRSMSYAMGPKIIDGLKKHRAYLGFFVCIDDKYVALANCNLNYSTWTARFIINIHDFIVSPEFRKQGIGEFLLAGIENYARERDFCKLNLEVRNDNIKAQSLYKKMGYTDCDPPMYFWQKELN